MHKYFFVFFILFTGGIFWHGAQAATLTCNSGTLNDVCTVSALNTMSGGDVISGSGSLIIASGGNITATSGVSISIQMGGDITIQSGGSITANLTGATSTNFTIDPSGSINATSKGYAGGVGVNKDGYGPGRGVADAGFCSPTGASYGGRGGTGARKAGMPVLPHTAMLINLQTMDLVEEPVTTGHNPAVMAEEL
jgi:hypothetical protein